MPIPTQPVRSWNPFVRFYNWLTEPQIAGPQHRAWYNPITLISNIYNWFASIFTDELTTEEKQEAALAELHKYALTPPLNIEELENFVKNLDVKERELYDDFFDPISFEIPSHPVFFERIIYNVQTLLHEIACNHTSPISRLPIDSTLIKVDHDFINRFRAVKSSSANTGIQPPLEPLHTEFFSPIPIATGFTANQRAALDRCKDDVKKYASLPPFLTSDFENTVSKLDQDERDLYIDFYDPIENKIPTRPVMYEGKRYDLKTLLNLIASNQPNPITHRPIDPALIKADNDYKNQFEAVIFEILDLRSQVGLYVNRTISTPFDRTNCSIAVQAFALELANNDSISNKLSNLNLTADEEVYFEEFLDPITHDFIDVPVILHTTSFDLNSLMDLHRSTHTLMNPCNRQSFKPTDITVDRSFLNRLEEKINMLEQERNFSAARP